MANEDTNNILLKHAIKLIAAKGIKNIGLQLVESCDDKCKCQIQIKDLETDQTFGLLANKRSDIDGLIYRLLDALLIGRNQTN